VEAQAERRQSRLDAYEPVLRELLARYPDMTAMRLFEELRTRGFAGKYTIVRQRVELLRPRPIQEPVLRFETPRITGKMSLRASETGEID
jgi:transposase